LINQKGISCREEAGNAFFFGLKMATAAVAKPHRTMRMAVMSNSFLFSCMRNSLLVHDPVEAAGNKPNQAAQV